MQYVQWYSKYDTTGQYDSYYHFIECSSVPTSLHNYRSCYQGVRVHIRQMGPMIQQTQAPCNACRQGKVIPEGKKCQKCHGVGTCKDRKVLEVFIEKGASDGHRIVFNGEADEKPDTIPGDVRFIIDQQVRHYVAISFLLSTKYTTHHSSCHGPLINDRNLDCGGAAV